MGASCVGDRMRGLGAVAAFAVLSAAASGAGYDDYVRGMSAYAQGKSTVAIEAFSAALKAGDLAPTYVHLAHIRRGMTYMETGQCRLAQDDLAAAAILQPENSTIQLDLAAAEVCLGDLAAADKAFAAAQNGANARRRHLSYGMALWQFGYFAAAADHFSSAYDQSPDDRGKTRIVPALLLAISAVRAKTFDPAAFAAKTATLTMTYWPKPILNLFLGKATDEAVYRQAASDDPVEAIQHRCEADFYIGEWNLVHGRPDAARAPISSAAQNCPHSNLEHGLAMIERDRLGK